MSRDTRSAIARRQKLADAVADTMFALSAPSRVQILICLLEGPHDVSELIVSLEMQQSTVSHQLRLLRDLGLVDVTRDGRRRVYELADDQVARLVEDAVRHVERRQTRRSTARARVKRAVL